MFERYTEHARRVIFFGRYETSQFRFQGDRAGAFFWSVSRLDPGLMSRIVPGTTGETGSATNPARDSPAFENLHGRRPAAVAASKACSGVRSRRSRADESFAYRRRTLASGLAERAELASAFWRVWESGSKPQGEQVVKEDGSRNLPNSLTPEEAATEREALRSMIGSLPDDALRRTRQMIEDSRII